MGRFKISEMPARALARIPGSWHSKKVLVAVPVVLGFLFVACTSAAAPAASNAGTQANGNPSNTTQAISNRPEDAAPDFQIPLFSNADHEAGELLKLSDLQGRPVVINFWFPSCPPCVAEMPDLEAAYQKHKGSVEFIGIQLLGLDTAEDGQDFVTRLGVNYALGPDETGDIIIKDYKVPGFPTTIFLDSDHREVRRWTGLLNEEKLEELIEEIRG